MFVTWSGLFSTPCAKEVTLSLFIYTNFYSYKKEKIHRWETPLRTLVLIAFGNLGMSIFYVSITFEEVRPHTNNP